MQMSWVGVVAVYGRLDYRTIERGGWLEDGGGYWSGLPARAVVAW